MKVVKNDLNSFLTKLAKVSRQTHKLQERVADIVVQKGLEIAKSQGFSSDIYSTGDKGSRKIIMSGEGLRYQEYGTGIVGDGTYEGKLPSEPITFESGKKIWTTSGWQYAYRNKQKPKIYPVPHKGFSARMPMYKTSVELQEFIRTKLKGELKK